MESAHPFLSVNRDHEQRHMVGRVCPSAPKPVSRLRTARWGQTRPTQTQARFIESLGSLSSAHCAPHLELFGVHALACPAVGGSPRLDTPTRGSPVADLSHFENGLE